MITLPENITTNEAGMAFLESLDRDCSGNDCWCKDMPCVRPHLGNLCGGLPVSMKKPSHVPDVPAWVVMWSFQKIRLVDGQQLSLFDGPAIYYQQMGANGQKGRKTEKRLWFAGLVFCTHGRDELIRLAYEDGATRVECKEIRRKKKCKRKVVVEDFLHCGR